MFDVRSNNWPVNRLGVGIIVTQSCTQNSLILTNVLDSRVCPDTTHDFAAMENFDCDMFAANCLLHRQTFNRVWLLLLQVTHGANTIRAGT